MATAPTSSPSKFVKDLTGQKFGRLTVIRYLRVNDSNNAIWLCECSCVKGKTCEAIGSNLKRGSKVSCGCYHDESAAARLKTHGMSKTPEFRAWMGAKDRVFNKNNRRYADYGGRGITMCDEWVDSFPKFHEDMGDRPSEFHSLERLDNNGPYSKANCVWALSKTQAQNRRNNRKIKYKGDELFISEWAVKTGIPENVLWYRVRANWPVGKMLTKKVRKYQKSPAPSKGQGCN